ncbi:MAG: insulinase family protein [Proteobacteria bacterium]|nr:peptidase M16 [Desulfobacteraceae bacterium]MBU3981748.1 insulinase family protein [Pseudomonadota bacterium]MBU4012359.1 insulinase family protein [Pseudomonadota bacterium]MBU4067229.1 insulinase family protein [Pseudomonadota bacterium]MBU4101927.1 insulinase family protein [Pseudomonadota bacterium]
MDNTLDQNNPDIKENDNICGYLIKKKVELKEIRSILYDIEHPATGARHIHISNNDKENTFGVALKTVPTDSTGVAHILEHTVLCGSRKFSVRDPFFSMLKRSLSTFMNAFTASDWTMYPFSTQNRKDFYGLMDVYLDSVFYPIINELSFKQEGHRLEIENNIKAPETSHLESSHLVYKGVVYNEMKGAMSSPDQVMAHALLNKLYPDTTYSNNSGGDPAIIPSLSYAQLKAFHKRHYHPSNAFFYTYGNLPLIDHLSFIQDKILKNFTRISPETDVPSQPRWDKPQKATYPYPIGRNEDPSKKYQICVAWLTADIRDSFEVLVLTLLEQILLGNSASPLRKALIDSNLGTALSDGTGYDSNNKDTLFVCGLKDVKKSVAGKIESIIFNVLNELATKGIDNKLIESAIHQVEFHRKEITSTPYPYGLRLLLTFSGSWLHGGKPEMVLQFDTDLSRLRDELSKSPLFENRIKKYFINNSHRVLLTLAPDQRIEEKEKKRVAKELKVIKAGLTQSDIEKINEAAEALKKLQEKKEDVSCLPTLEIEDIPPSVQTVHESETYCMGTASCYNQPTYGIFYFSSAAGTGSLQNQMLPLVPFFCYAFSKTGTKSRAYTDLARLIDAYTGGIVLSAHAHTNFEGAGACMPFITLNGKCLVRNQSRMFEIIKELLYEFDFSDLDRLKSLLLEYRAKMESMIIHNGHRLAISLASRNFSTTCALSETWHGIHQLQTIKNITDNLIDNKLESVSDNLSSIGKDLLVGNNFKIALIGEDQALSSASSHAVSIQKGLDEKSSFAKPANGFISPAIGYDDEITREGWSTYSAVSFVARAFQTVRMEHEDAPALSVISKMLRSLYLHREIREKGGAYGGFSIYDSENGIFCFASYRDPHIVSTLKVYDDAMIFIKSGDYDEEDIKEAILQICSEIDKPDPPGPAARKAFYRKLISLSDDARNHFKTNLLSLKRNQVIKVAEKYFNQEEKKQAVAVISSEEKLKEANQKIKGNPLNLFKI